MNERVKTNALALVGDPTQSRRRSRLWGGRANSGDELIDGGDMHHEKVECKRNKQEKGEKIGGESEEWEGGDSATNVDQGWQGWSGLAGGRL